MKKIILILSSIFLCAALVINPASAHELESDTTIGAVLHIQPNDSPVVGEETTYRLAFTDTANKLDLNACDCSVEIKFEGNTIETRALTASSKLESTDTYIFKEAGLYTLIATGKPKALDTFGEFTLTYPIRVTSPKQIQTQAFPIALAVGFGLLIIILLLVAVRADRMLGTPKK